jgi:hypothetical protein
LAALAGSAVGYACLSVIANLEDRPFYALRSFVTQRSAMSEIVTHPADRWIVPVLLAGSVSLGAASGVLIAKRSRPPKAEAHSRSGSGLG